MCAIYPEEWLLADQCVVAGTAAASASATGPQAAAARRVRLCRLCLCLCPCLSLQVLCAQGVTGAGAGERSLRRWRT